MDLIQLAEQFRKKIDANLQATRKLVRVDELTEEDTGMLALMVSMLMSEVDMLKMMIGGM